MTKELNETTGNLQMQHASGSVRLACLAELFDSFFVA